MALKLQTNLSKDLNSCLGVFGQSSDTTERDLWEVFSKYGSRGFAYIYFEKRDDAAEVQGLMNFKYALVVAVLGFKDFHFFFFFFQVTERANGMELDWS